jgi:hypothetical protein
MRQDKHYGLPKAFISFLRKERAYSRFFTELKYQYSAARYQGLVINLSRLEPCDYITNTMYHLEAGYWRKLNERWVEYLKERGENVVTVSCSKRGELQTMVNKRIPAG